MVSGFCLLHTKGAAACSQVSATRGKPAEEQQTALQHCTHFSIARSLQRPNALRAATGDYVQFLRLRRPCMRLAGLALSAISYSHPPVRSSSSELARLQAALHYNQAETLLTSLLHCSKSMG